MKVGRQPKFSPEEGPEKTQKCDVSGESSSRDFFKLTIPVDNTHLRHPIVKEAHQQSHSPPSP
jgi:hypothetical protein